MAIHAAAALHRYPRLRYRVMAFFVTGYPRLLTLEGGPVIIYVDEGWGADRLGEVEAAVAGAASSAQ